MAALLDWTQGSPSIIKHRGSIGVNWWARVDDEDKSVVPRELRLEGNRDGSLAYAECIRRGLTTGRGHKEHGKEAGTRVDSGNGSLGSG